MRWTDEMRIETPEQITVDLELAGLGSRFVAQVVDWTWKVLVTLLVIVLAAIAMAAAGGQARTLEDAPIVLQAAAVAGLYVLWLGYGVYFEVRRNGQTPGKRTAGIRVVRQGGGAIDVQAAAVRNLLAVADFLPVFHLLGAVLVLLTANRQRLGDLAAGTVVIRERVVAADAAPADLGAAAAADLSFTPAQLAGITPADRAVLRAFLQRYDGMDAASRGRLAISLADKYRAATGHPTPADPRDADEARAFLASLFRDAEELRKLG